MTCTINDKYNSYQYKIQSVFDKLLYYTKLHLRPENHTSTSTSTNTNILYNNLTRCVGLSIASGLLVTAQAARCRWLGPHQLNLQETGYKTDILKAYKEKYFGPKSQNYLKQ